MVIGRVTPSTRGAEISGSDYNGAREAPLWVICTFDLVA